MTVQSFQPRRKLLLTVKVFRQVLTPLILSNAQWLTEGESGQGRQTAAASYLLTNSDLNLGDHVGHKVQLTGYVDSSGASSPSSMRVFHATSVRMLSATCQ